MFCFNINRKSPNFTKKSMENPTSEGFGPPGTAPIPVLDTHTHYFVFSSSQGLEVLRDVSVSILPDGVRSTPVVEVVTN